MTFWPSTGKDSESADLGGLERARRRVRPIGVALATVGMLGILAIDGGGVAGPGAAQAAEGPWAEAQHVDARLVSAVSAVGDLETLPLGVHMRLAPEWKTYWRSPGDAGLPPDVRWDETENVADWSLAFPAPHRFELFGFQTFGYDYEVVLPLAVTPEVPGDPVSLSGELDVLACSDICIPYTLDIAIDIPAGSASQSEHARLVERFASQVPRAADEQGIAVDAVEVVADGDGEALSISLSGEQPFTTPDILIEMTPHVAFTAPEIDFSDDDHRITATFGVQRAGGIETLAGREALLTITDRGVAAEHAATIEGESVGIAEDALGDGGSDPLAGLVPGGSGGGGAGSGDGGATAAGSGGSLDVGGWLAMLGVALLGGLILNLMPCVLPVLSLKLLSVVKSGGQTPAQVRVGFLASAAGIVTSFMVLAGGLISLQAAGGAVGWGIQFQQPLFITVMVVIISLFAANLFGLYQIPLPRFIADAANSAGRERGHVASHFATGAFATLLATPCSAPFLGTAVGFALSRGPIEIVAIFLALGVGLALPYLLVAAVPGIARLMPRPGRWMIHVRRVMGLALLATAVWLVSVLAVQTGTDLAIALAATLAVAACLLIIRPWLRPAGRATVHAGLGVVLLGALALPLVVEHRPLAIGAGKGERVASGIAWQDFDTARIETLVAGGETVFLDVTADWCITCQANKRLVVERGDVAEALRSGEVVAMQADWTRPDPAISAYLERHGRYGIPFNIVYGPDAPDGIILPELLTSDAVLDAFDRAGAGTGPLAGTTAPERATVW